jgi:hypothetical protein
MVKKMQNKKKRKISKFVYWTPRIVSIVFLLFLAMFSLDVFGNGYNFWQTVAGLFMHNIPVFILTILLIISWKHELVGAIAFALGGILYIGQMIWNALHNTSQWYMLSYSLIIAGPAIFIAILFYLNWKYKKKINSKD